MAITVTIPVAKPTNVVLTLVAGGSLPIGTTYYVAVAGFDGDSISPYAQYTYQLCFHGDLSDASAPSSVTTDATYRSIQVSWTDAAGADRYGVYLSETQDDFAGLKTFETTREGNPNIQSPYLITDVPQSTYINHSCMLVNDLTNDINKNLGNIKVSFTGTEGHDLDDVYDAIVSAGFSDYAYYDSHHFTIKGSFIFEGTDSGAFATTRKSLVFIKGVISKFNPNYSVRFGSYTDEYSGANYPFGCVLDFQNSRYPIYAGTAERLEFYGCMITSAASIRSELTENEYYIYYYGGAQQYLGLYLENFKDSLLAMSSRGTYGVIRDTKLYSSYHGGEAHINVWEASAGFLHTGVSDGFYRCRFGIHLNHVVFYHYAGDTTTYQRDFYDCEFLGVADKKMTAKWSNLQVGESYADGNSASIRCTIKLKITDANGNDIVGADVSIKDKNGSEVTLYTKDPADDDRVLGSTTSPVVTDSNGEIDYYLESYLVEHEDGNSNIYALDITENYPFEITVSASGYQAFRGKFDIVEKAEWEIALQPAGETVLFGSTIYGSTIQ